LKSPTATEDGRAPAANVVCAPKPPPAPPSSSDPREAHGLYEQKPESRPPDERGAEDIAGKTLAEILGQLKPGQLRALIAGCIAVLGAAFTLGVTIGGG
jgi:hypothetical protein